MLPNILLILVDDMNAAFSPYITMKDPLYNKTPNIDELISESNVFMNAYNQYPVCGPSRSSIFTGKYPDMIKNYNFIKKIDNEYTIPKYLKSLNYTTISIGKTFHDPYIEINNNKLYNIYRDHWDKTLVYDESANNECKGNKIMCKKTSNTLSDYKITKEAIKMIKNIKKHWFISIGYRRPHISLANPTNLNINIDINKNNNTLIFDERNLNYYGYCDDLRSKKLSNGNTILDGTICKSPKDIPIIYPDFIDQFKKSYYTSIIWIDSQIGKILNVLKQEKKWDSTIIILTADHGWHSGENGFWCKNSLMELNVKAPLIIKDLSNNKKIINNLFELVNIFSYIKNNTIINSNYAFSQYPRCKIKGEIQDHPCMNGSCDNLPTIKYMGYSVREIVNGNLYSFTGWWEFNEERKCDNLYFNNNNIKSKNKYPIITKSKVLWDKSPIDTVLFMNNNIIKNDKLEKKYINIIINKFSNMNN